MSRSRPTLVQATAVLAVLGLGLVGWRAGYATFQGRDALLGLATGMVVAGCGLVAWRRASASRVGPLLVVAAIVWLPSDWRLATEPIAVLHDWFRLAYASVITHAALTYPGGRAGTWGLRRAVTAGYLAAVLPSVIGSALIAGLLIRAACLRPIGGRDSDPDSGAIIALAGALFGVVLALTSLVPFVGFEGRVFDLRLIQELAFVLLAGVIAHRLVARRERMSAADLVLDLTDAPGGGLAFQLGLALDDPTLQIGFRLGSGGTFVDADGRVLSIPPPGSVRAVTPIQRDGATVALIIHQARAVTDIGLTTALRRATELAAANAALQAEFQAQGDEVNASRRRLIAAAQAERAGLEQRLRAGPGRRLSAVLKELEGVSTGSPAIDLPLSRISAQLAGARADLDELADGLHPSILDRVGLAGAIAALAERSPVPVEVRVAPAVRGTKVVEATIYFVTSEALANAAKHAHASRVVVALAGTQRSLMLDIQDDGVGGARLSDGSGLRGLRDRVQSEGGTFHLRSIPGYGTHLAITIPDGEVQHSGRSW